MLSRTTAYRPCRESAALTSAEPERSFSPMMYPPPPCISARRFRAEENPRSATQITRDNVHSRRSWRTWRIRALSPVPPGQDQTRTGIPSLVTAMPTTTCGRSSRESLDFPCARAEPGLISLLLAAVGHALPVLVARHFLVGLLSLEVGGGGVEEKQVHFEVQQVGDLEVRLPGQAGARW